MTRSGRKVARASTSKRASSGSSADGIVVRKEAGKRRWSRQLERVWRLSLRRSCGRRGRPSDCLSPGRGRCGRSAARCSARSRSSRRSAAGTCEWSRANARRGSHPLEGSHGAVGEGWFRCTATQRRGGGLEQIDGGVEVHGQGLFARRCPGLRKLDQLRANRRGRAHCRCVRPGGDDCVGRSCGRTFRCQSRKGACIEVGKRWLRHQTIVAFRADNSTFRL
jgi:hypothetical protein